MTDDEREARAASWDDDGQPFEGIVNGLTVVVAAVFVCWFFWRLAEVLT